MKIGILTLPLHTNYGGILQAYALQTVIEKMGHEVIVFDAKRHDTNIIKLLLKIPYRLLRNWTKHTNYDIIQEFHIMKREKNTSRFIKKYIHTESISDISQVKESQCKAIVVGSDQVWSPVHGANICGSVINAFLPIEKDTNVKFISYAASFGKDAWGYSAVEEQKCKELIQHFDAVSVREDSGVSLCKTYLEHDAMKVIDPTLLLDSNDYISKLGIQNVSASKGNLLLYIINSTTEKNAIAKYVEDILSLKAFTVNSKVEDSNSATYTETEKIQPPVEEWVRGFYDADFVVTDSFHACVFSILFKKDFIVTGNAGRGNSRFDSLLKTFGLENRMISNANSTAIEEALKNKIDYTSVYEILSRERAKALSFLTDNV